MEEIITIIVILIIGLPMIYMTYIQMMWLFFRDKIESNQKKELKSKLASKNIELIHLYVPTKRKLKEAPFKKGLDTLTGASDIMSLQKDYYFVIKYRKGEIEKEGWVKIIESVFTKTKFTFYNV